MSDEPELYLHEVEKNLELIIAVRDFHLVAQVLDDRAGTIEGMADRAEAERSKHGISASPAFPGLEGNWPTEDQRKWHELTGRMEALREVAAAFRGGAQHRRDSARAAEMRAARAADE